MKRAVFFGLSLASAACSTAPDEQAVRSLEGSGAVAFVCLGKPGTTPLFHDLADCSLTTADTVINFGTDGTAPHLYGLVTQTTRGEVAMVDMSTTTGFVLDDDPSSPGASLFPVGTTPVAIVASPKGTAAFVASAELARPALYAFAVNTLRPCDVDPSRCGTAAPTISSWPSCRLPSAPGAMKMIADPAVAGETRVTCSDPFTAPDETDPRGSIDAEGYGREKLAVTLPGRGELVILDAQTVLDSDPGSLAPCPIEKTITLSTSVPAADPQPHPVRGPACVDAQKTPAGLLGPFASQPSGMSYGGGRLYIGDLGEPLIHVIDMASPCDATEIQPFAPRSMEDPSRVVRTTEVSVAPALTTDLKRFLYAVDVDDKSVMVFDASDGSTKRQPLQNPNADWNPLQPADRIRFAAAPVSIDVVQRDQPATTSDGVAPFGTRCDPTPGLTACSTLTPNCDIGTSYRTATDYTAGAGPLTLRGSFAVVGLSSGSLALLDVDDFDSACRGPSDQSSLLGCTGTATGLFTSDEQTCNVIVPNEPRSADYVVSNGDVGHHLAGIQTYPILSNKDGDVLTDNAHMRATIPPTGTPQIWVNGDPVGLDATGLAADPDGPRDALLMNLEDPRVQVADQDWAVVFEGALPGFAHHAGNLDISNGTRNFYDASASFCGAGVESENAISEILAAQGADPSTLAALAESYADRVTITNAILPSDNDYWTTANCSFEQCRGTFGDDTLPTSNRDIVITEAFDGHLELADPPAGVDATKCCFPSVVGYEIRPGNQWVVIGAISGFFHHVVASLEDGPLQGVCRDSCDPHVARLNGRVRATTDETIAEGSTFAFQNPMFRFAITAPPSDAGPSERDSAFRFTTEGSFAPLQVDLTDSMNRTDVSIRSLSFLPSIDSFVVSDGALEGLLILTGDLVSTPKQIF